MSITVYGGKEAFDSKGERYIDSVFTNEETDRYIWPEDPDSMEDPIENPKYRPEFDVNMSNGNAYQVLSALGIVVQDGFFSMDAKLFQHLCQAWLRQHVGWRDPGRATVRDGNMIDCGVHPGYLNERIHQLAVFAAEAIERGAIEIYGC